MTDAGSTQMPDSPEPPRGPQTDRTSQPDGPKNKLPGPKSGQSRKDTEQQQNLTWQAKVATVLTLRLTRWALAVAVVGVTVSIVVGFASCSPNPTSSQTGTVSGTGNNLNQNSGTQNEFSNSTCGQLNNGSTCVIQLRNNLSALSQSADTDKTLKAELAKKATAPPAGAGPWPFVVVDSGIDGLYPRSTNELYADRLGIARNRSIVWAECVATSHFTPLDLDPVNNVGPRWLRVRWKTDTPSQPSFDSDPSDTKRVWMYFGFLVPLEHNGQIPAC